jgi:acyl-CoA dehydrogenase
VAVVSEALEAFGGAGYLEDTGLPMLLRDAQVLPIWEGTTNVLALDAIRALGADDRAFTALKAEVTRCLASVHDQRLAEPARIVQSALAHAGTWLAQARKSGAPALEAGARRFSLTLGRATELALLCRHAQWSQENESDARATDAARRFGASGINLLAAADL